jgi:hypothetical protein
MANGDAAIASGMDVVLATDDRRQGYDEINKTRDYIATRVTWDRVSGKPTAFPSTPHGHPAQEIHPGTGYFGSGSFGFPNDITVNQNIYTPGATAATSSYTVAYINGDGRLSRGASARRYKKHVSDVNSADLGDIFPQLVRYQMRSGDGDWKLGYIADDLAGTDGERFIVRVDGEVESIDFIQMLLAQTAQLHARVVALEAKIDAAENEG